MQQELDQVDQTGLGVIALNWVHHSKGPIAVRGSLTGRMVFLPGGVWLF
jgi:hypothetical protein